MNRSQISLTIIILLSFILYIGCKQHDTTSLRIEIQVPPGTYDSLSYHLSKESFTAYSLLEFERLYFGSTGHVSFDVEANRIGWFFITLFPSRSHYKLKNKSTVFMLVRPGESYSIKFDSAYPLLFRISGDFEEAQNLYNQFNNSDICYTPRMNWYTNSDSLPSDLLAHLDDSIYNSIEPFKNLYEQNKVDDEYFKTIQTQIQYSQADALLDNLEIRERVRNEPRFLEIYNLKSVLS